MKCSAEDSTVAIALTTENGQARAGVADRGRGIGDADSAGLSSRFRRGSNVVDVVGSGLVCLSAPALAFDIEDRIRTGQKVPQAMLSILSTTDIPAAEPLLRAYLQERPAQAVDYVVALATALPMHRARWRGWRCRIGRTGATWSSALRWGRW